MQVVFPFFLFSAGNDFKFSKETVKSVIDVSPSNKTAQV